MFCIFIYILYICVLKNSKKMKAMKKIQIEIADNGYDTIQNGFLSSGDTFVWTSPKSKIGGIFASRLSLSVLCSQDCINAIMSTKNFEDINEYVSTVIAGYLQYSFMSIDNAKLKAYQKAKRHVLQNRVAGEYAGYKPVKVTTFGDLSNVADNL